MFICRSLGILPETSVNSIQSEKRNLWDISYFQILGLFLVSAAHSTLMAALRSTAGQNRKDCARNSTGISSEQYEISSIGTLAKKIRCFGCNRIPDGEIFSCLSGHLTCNICKPGNDICSRTDCTKILQRSIITEMFLNEITFKCPWSKFGCNEASIPRNQLTLHKKTCEKK